MRAISTYPAIVALFFVFGAFAGCNISDEADIEDPECRDDADCPDGQCHELSCVECVDDGDCTDGVCHNNQCQECRENDDCDGDDICHEAQCTSGCDEFDCGPGGTCVDEGGSISCQCDDDSYLVDGVCESCDCDLPNTASTSCDDAGVCSIDACEEGFTNEDGDPSTGCECGTDDYPDPFEFQDANCDGIDGDLDRAVFVSPGGNDGNDGRSSRPVRSIQRGVDVASQSGGSAITC